VSGRVGVGENRETAAKTQPFPPEFRRGCGGGGGFGRDDNPKTGPESGQLLAINLAESSFDQIADHGASDTTGDDNGTLHGCSLIAEYPHPKIGPVKRKARGADLCMLVTRAKARGTRQIKPGCDGRNEPRPPSGEGACVHADDDGSGWRDRLWSACVHGSRTGVYACAWKVGRCASYQ